MVLYNILKIIDEKDEPLFNPQNPIFKNYSFISTNITEDIDLICQSKQIHAIIICGEILDKIEKITSNKQIEQPIIILKRSPAKFNFHKIIYIAILQYPFQDQEIKQTLDNAIAYYNLKTENAVLLNEIKRLENREFSLLKKEVLNNLSHEIRTPLNAIIGFANLLTNSNKTANQNEEYVAIIEESSNRLINYIENLSEFLRQEKTIAENFTWSYISPKEILQSIVSVYQDSALHKKIILQLEEIPHALQQVKIKTNKHKIITILSKLITSAIYNGKNGMIQLGITKNNQDSICIRYIEKFETKTDFNTLLVSLLSCKENTRNTLDNEIIEVTLIKRYIKHLKGSYRFHKEKNKSEILIELPIFPVISLSHIKSCKEIN